MTKPKEGHTRAGHDARIVYTTQDLALQKPLQPISSVAFATALRVLLQNWRQGTVACQGRSDVSHSNKKPWKQKGTGRARAGSARSPLWRGGGVIHGPQARTRQLYIGKDIRKKVFATLLAQRLDSESVIQLDWQPTETPKTQQAYALLKKAHLVNMPIMVLAQPHDIHVHASFANIPDVQIIYFDQPNVFNLSRARYWVFLKKDVQEFNNMVAQWI